MSLTADLSGRIALVTGASQGLGRHFAVTLAQAGAAVGLAARAADQLAEARAEVEAAGAKAAIVTLDVTDESSVADAVRTIEASLGGIDILVNNAGIAITKSVLEQEAGDWDAVMDTNLRGAFLVARTVATGMKARQQGGSIINVASVLGLTATRGVAPYAVSKAGLIHLTEVMGLELARYGIRVNALAPGYIETAINRDVFATEAGQSLIRRIAQRRLGQPDELDGALLLLASDASRYMTGSVVVVDGGFRLG